MGTNYFPVYDDEDIHDTIILLKMLEGDTEELYHRALAYEWSWNIRGFEENEEKLLQQDIRDIAAQSMSSKGKNA